ncbi:MAG: phosphatidylglycerophosphatase A [Deltaproteobacteria bacterium]|nr:phosphatidylglycerophosphatase A [Deltaproteobacteria bacterium]
MKKTLVKFLATGTYLGYSPVMPGTFGTLWGIPLAWYADGLGLQGKILLFSVVFLASVYIAGECCRILGKHDPGSIVIDEVCGYLVSFAFIPFTLANAILIFLLFRFFDILKPYPVRLIDRKVKGGSGVVIDDVAAGIYANISAHIILRFF